MIAAQATGFGGQPCFGIGIVSVILMKDSLQVFVEEYRYMAFR